MTVETAVYINTLNPANPSATDLKAEGDDHLRLTKQVLQTTFPNITAAVTATAAGLNAASSVASSGTFPGVSITGVTSVSVAQTGAFDNRLTFDALGVAGGAVGFNNSGATNAYGAVTGAAYVGIAQAVPMVFTSGAAEWLRTDGTGKLFVGTTTGAAKFNVANTGTNQTLNLLNSSSGSGSTIIGAYTNGTDADFSVTVSQVGAASKFTRIGTSVANPLSLQTAGTNWITLDGVGRLSGTALHNNSSSPTGTTNQYIASGTYTPTLTSVSNFSAISAVLCQWLRVGNVVTVSGSFTASCAGSTQGVLGISFPIPSTVTAVSNGAGQVAKGSGTVTGYVLADTVNARAQAVINNDGVSSSFAWPFSFTYVVL